MKEGTGEMPAPASIDPYRLMVEASRDILLVGTPWGLEWVSPATSELLGFTPEEVRDASPITLVHPDDAPSLELLQSEVTAGRTVQGRCRLRHADGHWLWFEARVRPLADADGEFRGRSVSSWRIVDAEVQMFLQLRESEKHFRTTMDDSAVGMSLTEPSGRFIRANRAMCDLLGLTEAQLGETTWQAITHPDDLAADAALVVETERGTRDNFRLMKRFIHAEGRIIWGDLLVSAVRHGDGTVRHYIAQVVDVTERMAAAAALRRSEGRYRMLAENASDVIVVGNNDDEAMSWVSPSIERTLGWTPAEWIGHSPIEFAHPDDLERLAMHVADRKPPPLTQYRVRTANGDYRWVSARADRLLDDDGNEVGRLAVLRDVHDEVVARELLEDSEERYRLLAEHASDVVVLSDVTGVVTWISPSIRQVLGHDPSTFLGEQVLDFVHPADHHRLLESRDKVTAGHASQYEARFVAGDGTWRWLSVNVTPVNDEQGNLTGRLALARDVDEQVAARTALARSEQRFRRAMESTPSGMAVVDLDRRFLEVNPSLCRLVGRDAAWLLEHTALDVVDPRDHHLDLAVREQLLTGDTKSAIHEARLVHADGSTVWVQHSIGVLTEHGVPGSFVSQFVDITETKRAQAELQRLATLDPLCGLPNRTALLEEVTRSLSAGERSGRPTAVLLIDLDHFKNVNDSLGHAVGDELLRAAARRIETCVRGGDLVARLGGDEFVVVMREIEHPEQAAKAAMRIVSDFRAPLPAAGNELYTTASVGIAISTETSDAEDLLREADTALYRAKEDGRDRSSLFNDDLRAEVTARLTIEAELRPALERGELVVWYQPEVDLVTGHVVAVEALLRWRHPSGELYGADRFIEVAEETGLILDIGDWVLTEVCMQAKRWADRSPDRPLTVRVNLSALQLVEAGLLMALDHALEVSGVDPSMLCIEITETTLLHDTSTVRENLRVLRERNLRVALDDFGTGYASLAYLRDYPVDVVKIDRSFVAKITTDDFDRRLVAGIVALAHLLGMAVTAEGVEHSAQAEVLRQLGCHGAQGFLYSPAVPPEQIDTILESVYPHP